MPTPTRVQLLTRHGCHLCVEAEITVRRVCADLGVGVSVVNIDDDERLRDRYTDHVPVTFVDDELHGYWVVDESALREALTSRPRMRDDVSSGVVPSRKLGRDRVTRTDHPR